jgi:hypothetical protein
MGREAKASQATRVKLEKSDYFELRAKIRDVEAVELDAMKAAQVFSQRRAAAVQVRNAVFESLAKQHGFDPTLEYGWDDATCELIPVTKKGAHGP